MILLCVYLLKIGHAVIVKSEFAIIVRLHNKIVLLVGITFAKGKGDPAIY